MERGVLEEWLRWREVFWKNCQDGERCSGRIVKMERGVVEEWLRWREVCWKSF